LCRPEFSLQASSEQREGAREYRSKAKSCRNQPGNTSTAEGWIAPQEEAAGDIDDSVSHKRQKKSKGGYKPRRAASPENSVLKMLRKQHNAKRQRQYEEDLGDEESLNDDGFAYEKKLPLAPASQPKYNKFTDTKNFIKDDGDQGNDMLLRETGLEPHKKL